MTISVYTPLLLLFSLVALRSWIRRHFFPTSLEKIPSISYKFPLIGDWIAAIWWTFGGAPTIVEQGYRKHANGFFRIPAVDSWVVVACGRLVEEIRTMPDEQLDFNEAADDLLQSKYTHRLEMLKNLFHVNVVRTQLTKSLGEQCLPLVDETLYSFDVEIDSLPRQPGTEWVKFGTLDTMRKIIARISTRVLLGPSICRDPSYIKLAIDWTIEVVIRGKIIKMSPPWIRPFIGGIMLRLPSLLDKAQTTLAPLIEERIEAYQLDPESLAFPTGDVLGWLIAEAPPEQRNIHVLTTLMMNLNLASIHSTSMVLTHILYHLASRPEYFDALREEYSTIIAEEGHSKRAYSRMTKLDSFIKETIRYTGGAAVSGIRKVMKPTSFSEGTKLDPGTIVMVATSPMHLDDAIYPGANEFDGFRFHDMRGQGPDSAERDSLASVVTQSNEYLAFGLGKHICPGRFFAVLQLKIVVGYMLSNYDMKLAGLAPGERPKDMWFGEQCVPSTTAEVMLRRRAAEQV